jgi:hypothetical protein
MWVLSPFRFVTVPAMALVFSICAHAQSVPGTEPRPGTLVGTVTDVNGDPVPNATVALEAPKGGDRRTLVTRENGFFQFGDVKRGTPYQINQRKGFCRLDIIRHHPRSWPIQNCDWNPTPN